MTKIQTFILTVLASLFIAGPLMPLVAPVSAAPLYVAAVTCGTCHSGGPSLSTLSTAKSTGMGETCLVVCYANPIVAVLSGLVGIFAVISIIAAGIQYSSASGDPSKVAAAKQRILKAVIAVLAFLFLLAFVEWLLPGGKL